MNSRRNDDPECYVGDPAWLPELATSHRRYLAARGVSPEVATARGYRSITRRDSTKAGEDLSDYGWGRRAPLKMQIDKRSRRKVLLTPLYHPGNGAPLVWQARPDAPRDGRKFELPHRTKLGTNPKTLPVDIHPLRGRDAADRTVDLLITSGITKADAVLTAAIAEEVGLVPAALTEWAIAIGGSGALSEPMRDLCAGRSRVYLCWDSDRAEDEVALTTLRRLGELLADIGVREVTYLGVPPLDTGRAGVDDWLASGQKLGDLLQLHRMSAPAAAAPASPSGDEQPESYYHNFFEVDEEELVLWTTEMLRTGANTKRKLTKVAKMWAVPSIEELIDRCDITGHEFSPPKSAFVGVKLRYWTRADGRRKRSEAYRTLSADELDNIRLWLRGDARTRQILCTVDDREQRRIVDWMHTMAEGRALRTIHVSSPGWVLYRDDGRSADGRSGWRYVHGGGWIGGADLGALSDLGTDAHVRLAPSTGESIRVDPSTESMVRYTGFPDESTGTENRRGAESYAQWLHEWVLGGDTPGPGALDEDPARQALRRYLTLGAIAVSRSLLPGRPAVGAVLLYGPSGAGKSLLARAWCGAFGIELGRWPLTSMLSTSAGVEVDLGVAANMLALVDDYRPGSHSQGSAMDRTVDYIARGAYDGASRARATRDLRSMRVPQIRGSVVITGEEVPVLSPTSNSTLQRLIVVAVRRLPRSSLVTLGALADKSTLANHAAGWMVGATANLLDQLTAQTTADDAADTDPGEDGRPGNDAFDTDPCRDDLLRCAEVQPAITALCQRLDVEAAAMTRAAEARLAVEAADLTNHRPIDLVQDLMLGAAHLLDLSGANDAVRNEMRSALIDVAAWLLAETIDVVRDTLPGEGLVELISAMLDSGLGHIVLPESQIPTSNQAAMTMGWRSDKRTNFRPQGHAIGHLVTHQETVVVAMSPDILAEAIRRHFRQRMSGDQVAKALAGMVDPVLAFGNWVAPTTSIPFGGGRMSLLLIRPDRIGVQHHTGRPHPGPGESGGCH